MSWVGDLQKRYVKLPVNPPQDCDTLWQFRRRQENTRGSTTNVTYYLNMHKVDPFGT